MSRTGARTDPRPSRAPALLRDALLAGPTVLLLACLVAVPIALLVVRSLLGADGLSVAAYAQLGETDLYRRLLGRSLRVATVVTLLSCALAWPAGWAISRSAPRHRAVLLGLSVVPYLTSTLLLIYAMLVLIAADGPLMSFLDVLGVADRSSSILYTPRATVVMLVYQHLPIMIVVLTVASERIPDDLLEAARSLGAGRIGVFARVVVPLTAPSFLAAFALVFVPVAGSFVEAQILGGPNGLLLGNVIADQVTRVNNPELAAVLSLLLLTSIVVVLVVLQALRQGVVAVRARRRVAVGVAR